MIETRILLTVPKSKLRRRLGNSDTVVMMFRRRIELMERRTWREEKIDAVDLRDYFRVRRGQYINPSRVVAKSTDVLTSSSTR